MARPNALRAAWNILAFTTGLWAAPASAVWGPDSVLTIGSAGTGTIPILSGFLPTGGSDLYVVWRWFPGSVGVTSLSRVTADGGLAFARRLDSTGLPGVGPDGLGGLIDAWSANGDIAFRHVTATGSSEPASPQNYWAAQTPDLDDFPAVAPDSAGGVYIGWTDQQGHFVVQRVTAAGGRAPGWPALGRCLTPAATDALLPDGSGGTYVLFQTDRARALRVLADTTLAPGWPAAGIPLESATGMAPKYTVSPSLVRSSADRTFAVWTEGISVFTNSQRIMVQSFSGAGELARPELDLTSFVSSVADLSAQPDGQDGLLLSWYQEAALEVAHVLADGTVAAGPFVANPSGLGALAPSRNGGFIVFGANPSGILATWYLADGSLDPSEPVNPRLVHPQVPGQPSYPVVAWSDGDGGALLVFDEETHPSSHEERMRHVFRAGLLDAFRPSRLALSLAPNPARTELTLELAFPTDALARLELLDVSGRRLFSRSIAGSPARRRERLDLPVGIAPGVYLVRVTQGAASRVQHFALFN